MNYISHLSDTSFSPISFSATEDIEAVITLLLRTGDDEKNDDFSNVEVDVGNPMDFDESFHFSFMLDLGDNTLKNDFFFL